MGAFETITNAIGLKFPEVLSKHQDNVFYSVKELKENTGNFMVRGTRPIVLFPEGTKTNGYGILNIDAGVIKLIDDASREMVVHSIRFDHIFNYYSPYNSYDELGLSSFMGIASQFTCKYVVQWYFTLNFSKCKNDVEKSDFVKKTLMIRRKE